MAIVGTISSLFMIVAAVYSHKWGVMYFLIITMIVMLFGKKFEQNKEKIKE